MISLNSKAISFDCKVISVISFNSNVISLHSKLISVNCKVILLISVNYEHRTKYCLIHVI